jgi:hypothetical protein
MNKKLVLALATVAASIGIGTLGCERPEAETPNVGFIRQLDVVRSGAVKSEPGVLEGAVVRAPDQTPFSSAATPLGWTDEAERRAAEEAFANGEAEAPHSIGGGPLPSEQ